MGPPDYKSSGLTTLSRYLPLNLQQREEVVSRCHGSNMSKKPQSCKYDRKKRKKSTCMTFPCMIALGSPYFSSIVRQCKWPSVSRKIIEIRKCSYHGNVTSQVSSLSNKALYTEIHSYGKNKITGQGPDIMNTFSKFLVFHYIKVVTVFPLF